MVQKQTFLSFSSGGQYMKDIVKLNNQEISAVIGGCDQCVDATIDVTQGIVKYVVGAVGSLLAYLLWGNRDKSDKEKS